MEAPNHLSQIQSSMFFLIKDLYIAHHDKDNIERVFDFTVFKRFPSSEILSRLTESQKEKIYELNHLYIASPQTKLIRDIFVEQLETFTPDSSLNLEMMKNLNSETESKTVQSTLEVKEKQKVVLERKLSEPFETYLDLKQKSRVYFPQHTDTSGDEEFARKMAQGDESSLFEQEQMLKDAALTKKIEAEENGQLPLPNSSFTKTFFNLFRQFSNSVRKDFSL